MEYSYYLDGRFFPSQDKDSTRYKISNEDKQKLLNELTISSMMNEEAYLELGTDKLTGAPIAIKVKRDPNYLQNKMRNKRERECFPIINRGDFWYNTLTEIQKDEIQVWYQAWLDVTETLVVPEAPTWLK